MDKWFNQLVAAYYKQKADSIKAREISIDDQRASIIDSIQKAENDGKILALSIVLDDFNRGKLSE